jgi:oligopeptidase A
MPGHASRHRPGRARRPQRGDRRRPASARRSGRQDRLAAGLDQPTYVAVVTDATSRDAAPRLLRGVVARAPRTRGRTPAVGQRTGHGKDISRCATRAAQLLEFRNYAEYALATRMARSVPEVLAFLRGWRAARARRAARATPNSSSSPVASSKPGTSPSGPSACSASATFISQEELRPISRCRACSMACSSVAQRLFGITIRERRTCRLASDVRYFDDQRARRRVHRQLLSRSLRAPQQAQRRVDGRLRRPQAAGRPVMARAQRCGPRWQAPAYLVCNVGMDCCPAGRRQAPAHAADPRRRGDAVPRVRPRPAPHADARGYPSIAGINGVAWDAVELPSQFMENYAWQPEVLANLAGHWQTGEPLPAELQAQLLRTRSFQAGLATAAPARVRAVRFPPARRIRPGAGRARRADPRAEVRARSP